MYTKKQKIIVSVTAVIMIAALCVGILNAAGVFEAATEQPDTTGTSAEPVPTPTGHPAANISRIELSCDKDFGVYTRGEQSQLIFTADKSADGTADITYTVTNISTNKAVTGNTSITYGNKEARAALSLDSGVYRVEFTSSAGETGKGMYLTVLIDDGITGGERFGMDFASSWHLNTRDRARYIEMLKLAGITHVRERISMSDTLASDGSVSLGKYEAVLETLRSGGFDTIITWHDLPSCMKTGNGPDLLAVYKQLKALAEAAGDSVSAWEIWNEQDVIHFGQMYPDEYAAYLKACAAAIDDSGSGALKVMGAFARTPEYSMFGGWMMENGITDYIDVYNFHVYTYTGSNKGVITDLDAVRQHLEFARRYGGDIAAWQTETGTIFQPAEQAGARSTDSLNQQAKFCVISAVASAAMGAERTYPFLLMPYGGTDELSFFSTEGYAYPAYGAYATAIKMLGDCNIDGRLTGDNGLTGYCVTRADGKRAAVLWNTALKDRLIIKTKRELTVTDMYGSQRVVSPENGEVALPVGGSPVYISCADGTLPDGIFEPFSPQYKAASAKKIPESGRIVIMPHFPAENAPDMPTAETVASGYEGVNSGYRFVSGETASVTLTVYNFSSRDAAGSISAALPAGWECLDGSVNITVPAYGQTSVTLRIKAGDTSGGFADKIVFSAVTDIAGVSDCVSMVSGR